MVLGGKKTVEVDKLVVGDDVIITELGIKEAPKKMLDVHKNPLLISILDGVDTLKVMTDKGELPPEYLQAAKGLLIMKTDKIGFGLSITQGYGLVIARAPERPAGWSAPLPIRVDGFSVGAVMGFSEQHTVICLCTDEEINNFKLEKRAMKMSLDLALNLQDMVNKDLQIDAQTMLSQAKTLVAQTGDTGLKTKAFTFSKGMMMDMSLKGTSVEPDTDDINNCYGASVLPADILNGKIKPPREAVLLYNTIKEAIEGVKPLLPGSGPGGAAPVATTV